VLLDDAGQRLLAGMLDTLPPGDTVEVVLSGAGLVASLPVELIRLATNGREVGPLGLLPRVSVYRRLAPPATDSTYELAPGGPPPAVAGLPRPLKVLAAVAAPDETKTPNVPLDVEAEMHAVMDAVGEVAGDPKIRKCRRRILLLH
jgi:hypothetical protein